MVPELLCDFRIAFRDAYSMLYQPIVITDDKISQVNVITVLVGQVHVRASHRHTSVYIGKCVSYRKEYVIIRDLPSRDNDETGSRLKLKVEKDKRNTTISTQVKA